MVHEIDYHTTSLVIESWEQLKRTKNYEQVAGGILFKILFEKCPCAKVLFGFPLSLDTTSPELLKNKRFIAHSTYLIEMLGTALNLLGPDLELLTQIMMDLGVKHVRYGVKPEMFPIMGEALIVAMNEVLDTELTEECVAAWKEIFESLAQDMVQAQVAARN